MKGKAKKQQNLRREERLRVSLEIFEGLAASQETCAERLKLLQQFAMVSIVRPDRLRLRNLRRSWEKMRQPFGERVCFVCWRTPSDWHHVVALKDGGLNWPENVVPICRACHKRVHPWLR